MGEGTETTTATSGSTAKARRPSESATLVCAVVLAVALGVACGFWINSLLASSAAARRAAPARATSKARAETPPADKTLTSQVSVETPAAAPLNTEPAATKAEAREPKQLAAAVGPAREEAATRPEARARLVASFVTRESNEPKGEEEQARPASPCALYASTDSLTMRGGGAAFLVVGGPGVGDSVDVTTQSWADIAVAREGRAANGWVRYAVKSISKRPGLYSVQFSTRCGSQTIPVTVK